MRFLFEKQKTAEVYADTFWYKKLHLLQLEHPFFKK